MRPAPERNGSGDAFRSLPSVDELLREPALTAGAWPRPLAVEAVRAALAAARAEIARGEPAPDRPALIERVLGDLRRRSRRSLRPLINATGVILHTNLGRAPISEAAARAMTEISLGYSNLEFDLASGERGSRQSHLRELLREVTGAVLLALSALASGREVIVSRGQAVEIGGGFRIPDVMRQSGATLVEVGTTNRTYVSDYEAAVTPRTALLLRVHPSNFRLEGFVHQVGLDELVELGRRLGIPVMDDLGSGALIDPRSFGLGAEPLVQESVRAGAAVVCFSGDKLLGGPQAGIIVGKRELIEVIRRHPLARAVRIDKASIAGLEVTLRHYQRGEALEAIPVWRMIACPVDRLIERARTIEAAIGSPRVQAAPMRAAVGGGSLPGQTLPSHGVVVQPGPAGSGDPAVILARRLREHDPPIIGRIEHDALWLDLRTVEPDRDAELVAALRDLIC